LVKKDEDDEEKIAEIIDNFMRIFSNLFGFPYSTKRNLVKKEQTRKRFSSLDVSVIDKGDKIEVYVNAPGLDRDSIKADIKDGNLYIYGKKENMEFFDKIDLKGKGKKVEKLDYLNGILSLVILKKKKFF